MHYLKLRRSRTILGLFATTALLFLVFPGIDIFISRLFFDQGFYLGQQWWTTLMKVTVRNDSDRPRLLSATGYVEWVLGDLAPKTAMHESREIFEIPPELVDIFGRALDGYRCPSELACHFVSIARLGRSVATR